MLLQRIIFSALAIGLAAGLVFTLIQNVGVTPIILAAEVFETAPVSHEHTGVDSHHRHAAPHSHMSGHPDPVAGWSPQNGFERTLYTFISNVFAGIGFAAVLLALMCLFQLRGITRLTLTRGMLWGVAGFIVFFAAPGLGLPPGIPGMEAAATGPRQLWWLSAALAAAAGIGLMIFAPPVFKAAGIAVIAVPYWIKAPQPAGSVFNQVDADVAAILSNLHSQFILATGLSNFIFWLLLGTACAWVLNSKIMIDGIRIDETSGV